jgi:GTPase SAR1 family protein
MSIRPSTGQTYQTHTSKSRTHKSSSRHARPTAPKTDPITITLFGPPSSGKSSLTLRLLHPSPSLPLPAQYDPTIEDSYSITRLLDGVPYTINLVDTAGQEEYRGLWGARALGSDGFVVVYDVTREESLGECGEWMGLLEQEGRDREERRERWIEARRERFYGSSANGSAGRSRRGTGASYSSRDRHGKSSSRRTGAHAPSPSLDTPRPPLPPISILVGNKVDLSASREISAREGLLFARRHGCGFMETSARERVNVEETFGLVVRRVVEERGRWEKEEERREREESFVLAGGAKVDGDGGGGGGFGGWEGGGGVGGFDLDLPGLSSGHGRANGGSDILEEDEEEIPLPPKTPRQTRDAHHHPQLQIRPRKDSLPAAQTHSPQTRRTTRAPKTATQQSWRNTGDWTGQDLLGAREEFERAAARETQRTAERLTRRRSERFGLGGHGREGRDEHVGIRHAPTAPLSPLEKPEETEEQRRVRERLEGVGRRRGWGWLRCW